MLDDVKKTLKEEHIREIGLKNNAFFNITTKIRQTKTPHIAECCCGKFKHPSKEEAEREKKNKLFLNVYKCPFCCFWHVGSNRKKQSTLNSAPKKRKRTLQRLRKKRKCNPNDITIAKW